MSFSHFSQKATVFECKFVPSLQIPIPVPNLRIESSNVSDQGFKLTPVFARVRLKQFLRASPIIPVHAKSAPALLCPQAPSQQEDWQGQIVAEFLQKFIAPVRRPVLAEYSVGSRATTMVTMISIINKKQPSRCANRTLRKAILMHETENLIDIGACTNFTRSNVGR